MMSFWRTSWSHDSIREDCHDASKNLHHQLQQFAEQVGGHQEQEDQTALQQRDARHDRDADRHDAKQEVAARPSADVAALQQNQAQKLKAGKQPEKRHKRAASRENVHAAVQQCWRRPPAAPPSLPAPRRATQLTAQHVCAKLQTAAVTVGDERRCPYSPVAAWRLFTPQAVSAFVARISRHVRLAPIREFIPLPSGPPLQPSPIPSQVSNALGRQRCSNETGICFGDRFALVPDG